MKKLFLTCLISLLYVGASASISPSEKQVLLDLYTSTNGQNWLHSWNINEPVENWYGITIENNKVSGIRLMFNNMEGTIPNSIGNLNSLRVLELSFNKISGSLPESLGSLEALEILAFNGNSLSGEIPTSLYKLTHLKQLHLSSNKLSGTIPMEVGYLENLEVFNVFDNELYGEIPIGFSKHKVLRELIVAENRLKYDSSFSTILLSNSGSKLDLNTPVLTPSTMTIIATESSDDEN